MGIIFEGSMYYVYKPLYLSSKNAAIRQKITTAEKSDK